MAVFGTISINLGLVIPRDPVQELKKGRKGCYQYHYNVILTFDSVQDKGYYFIS